MYPFLCELVMYFDHQKYKFQKQNSREESTDSVYILC